MRVFEPMLAEEIDNLEEAKKIIQNGEWQVEFKLDGERAIIYYEKNKGIKIQNRRGIDITYRYPELQNIKLNCESAVLDCEIICSNLAHIYGDFQALQKRAHLQDKNEIYFRMNKYPVRAVAFDLLYCDGVDLTKKPLCNRQEILKRISENNYSRFYKTNIVAEKIGLTELIDIFELTEEYGIEGIMLKNSNSVYEEGKRSGNWLKLKHIKTIDLEVKGFEESIGEKGNAGFVIKCDYENNEIRVAVNSLDYRKKVKEAFAKQKKLVAEIKYLEKTQDGKLRQPTLKRIYENRKV